MPEIGPFNPLDAEQRNERLHHFSHALKNRMGSLWQAATLLHDLPTGPDRSKLLELAEKSFFNGAAELEHLMDDFKVPRGIVGIRLADVDIAPLLQECVASTLFRTERKDQRVDSNVAGPLKVRGERQVLQQLFEALLSNASKFSPHGGPIEVKAFREGDSVFVEVKDDGLGLTTTDLEHVFTRYALLSTRSTGGESQARSTLARAKQWAEVHGGTLEARSDGPGHGATFRVRLPGA